MVKVPDTTTDDNIPPCNRDATTPDAVYNLYDIIPRDTFHSLTNTIDQIKETDLTGYFIIYYYYFTELKVLFYFYLLIFSSKSVFYQNTFKALLRDHNCKRKLAILEYINGTCKWLTMPIRSGKRKTDELCPTSADACDFIVQNYSTTSTAGR